MLCVFLLYCFIVSCVCLVCIFLLLKALSISSRCVIQLQVLFAWTYGHHLHRFVICSPFQINVTHDSSKYSPSHFSCYSYHGIFNSYHFHQQKTKPNRFYVGVGCLASCSNNNIVNRLKQEALFQGPFDIGTHDLIVQELFLKNLRKQANLWKLHQKPFHIWGLLQDEQ